MDASRFNLQQSSSTNRSVIDLQQPQKPQSSRLASLNVYPRQEDINTAFKDLVLYREWKRVAILYTGLRDGDGSGASALHLQHLLIHSGVDCLTRRLPDNFGVRKFTFFSFFLLFCSNRNRYLLLVRKCLCFTSRLSRKLIQKFSRSET